MLNVVRRSLVLVVVVKTGASLRAPVVDEAIRFGFQAEPLKLHTGTGRNQNMNVGGVWERRTVFMELHPLAVSRDTMKNLHQIYQTPEDRLDSVLCPSQYLCKVIVLVQCSPTKTKTTLIFSESRLETIVSGTLEQIFSGRLRVTPWTLWSTCFIQNDPTTSPALRNSGCISS